MFSATSLTTTLDDAVDLVDRVAESGLISSSPTTTGYPMVRQARALIAAARSAGPARQVVIRPGMAYRAARARRRRAGRPAYRSLEAGPAAGCPAHGTHAFISPSSPGEVVELAADLSTAAGRAPTTMPRCCCASPPGRAARWRASRRAGLRQRLASARFRQQWRCRMASGSAERLPCPVRSADPHLTRSGAGLGASATVHAGRLPAGHSEGYVEASVALRRCSDVDRHSSWLVSAAGEHGPVLSSRRSARRCVRAAASPRPSGTAPGRRCKRQRTARRNRC
jgi:hypothetical protein